MHFDSSFFDLTFFIGNIQEKYKFFVKIYKNTCIMSKYMLQFIKTYFYDSERSGI